MTRRRAASADRSLLRASLAISESEYCGAWRAAVALFSPTAAGADSDDENDEERDEHSVSTSAASPARGGTGAVGEKKDDDQHLLKEVPLRTRAAPALTFCRIAAASCST